MANTDLLRRALKAVYDTRARCDRLNASGLHTAAWAVDRAHAVDAYDVACRRLASIAACDLEPIFDTADGTAPTFLERHAATLEAQRMRDMLSEADAKICSLLREVDTLRGWVRVAIDGGMLAPSRDTPERCAAVDGLAAFARRE